MDLSSRSTVLGAELAGEALPVSEAPIDDQPGQSLSVDRPTPRCPDWPGLARMGVFGRWLDLGLVVTGRQQDLASIGRFDVGDQ